MPYNIPQCEKCSHNKKNGGECQPDKDKCILNSSNSNQVQYSDITSGNYVNDDSSQYMNL